MREVTHVSSSRSMHTYDRIVILRRQYVWKSNWSSIQSVKCCASAFFVSQEGLRREAGRRTLSIAWNFFRALPSSFRRTKLEQRQGKRT